MSYAFAWVSIHSLRKAIMPMLKYAMSLRLLGKLKCFNLGSVANKFCTFKCLEKIGLQNPAQCVSYTLVPKHFSFFLSGLRLKFSFAASIFCKSKSPMRKYLIRQSWNGFFLGRQSFEFFWFSWVFYRNESFVGGILMRVISIA